MSSTRTVLKEADRPSAQRASEGEVFVLCSFLISLVLSCILWSAHKQAWMDELLTWKEVSDPSLWHLYSAIQHGADGGMPVFYTTAWLWAKAFGTGVLTLRLYSCIAMCGALLVTWSTIRRFYGMWATAFGVLAFWGTSGLLLDQNAEARFYGLFILTVAVAVDVYARLVMQSSPNPRLLVLSFVSQAALVLTHVLGIFYGGLILLALVVSDATRRSFRPRLYLSHAAGWLALLVWVPAIRASMAAGKPHVWMVMPTVKFLVVTYLFEDFEPWLRPLRHQPQAIFQVLRQATEWGMLISLALIGLLGLRGLFKAGQRSGSAPRKALLLVAYLLLFMPVVLFVLSHLINPVFHPRYLLPCGIGVAIILADFADGLGADSPSSSRLLWGSIVCFFVVSPVAMALSLPPVAASPDYLDVPQVDHVIPPNVAVVVGWQQDFSRLMRFSLAPQTRYYFLLDWPAAVAGPRPFVLDYHLMRAYRDNGYYSRHIQESHGFLCSHPDFLVLNAEQHSWFDLTIKRMPQFEWKVVHSFDALDPKRTLIAVHRSAPLDICSQPE